MATAVFTGFDVRAVDSSITRSDDMNATLTAAGYTGSLMDKRRKDYIAKLGLTEPVFMSDAGLELTYLRSLGRTGSIADMRIQQGIPNFP